MVDSKRVKLPGVSWHSRYGKYVALIMIRGKRKHLGYFDDPKEAHQAYLRAREADPIPEVGNNAAIWREFYEEMDGRHPVVGEFLCVENPDQEYHFVGIKNDVDAKGQTHLSYRWRAQCATCDEWFETMGWRGATALTRNCDLHKAQRGHRGKRAASPSVSAPRVAQAPPRTAVAYVASQPLKETEAQARERRALQFRTRWIAKYGPERLAYAVAFAKQIDKDLMRAMTILQDNWDTPRADIGGLSWNLAGLYSKGKPPASNAPATDLV